MLSLSVQILGRIEHLHELSSVCVEICSNVMFTGYAHSFPFQCRICVFFFYLIAIIIINEMPQSPLAMAKQISEQAKLQRKWRLKITTKNMRHYWPATFSRRIESDEEEEKKPECQQKARKASMLSLY